MNSFVPVLKAYLQKKNITGDYISKKVSRRYSTVMRELSVFDRAAKLGLDDFINICMKTCEPDIIYLLICYMHMEDFFEYKAINQYLSEKELKEVKKGSI